MIEAADSNDTGFNRQRKQIDNSKIIIHPGAGSIRKRWPLANFLELAAGLENRGLKPQFVCGPAELDLMVKIQSRNRRGHTFIELTDLADWIESAGAYIGNDSGVSHLAAFLGLPGVVIFGPSDPARWKPPGPEVKMVRPELDCQPCFEIELENCSQPVCRTDATPGSVLTAFDQVYSYGPNP
jgi:ADP-heptose:LPS heptosyltransferase